MYDYYHKCAIGNVIPFNQSLVKFISASLLLGLITTIILLYTIFSVLWDSLKDSCKKD